MFNLNLRQRSRRRRPNSRQCLQLERLEGRVVLSTFRVNTTLDAVAVNLKNGQDAAGQISLRSAIMAADARGGNNQIILPAGTFTLTLAGAGEDKDATGDLDINANVTIKGQGASNTIIDGNNLDRVIQVLGGRVSISAVTIQHGLATGSGGGLLNSGGIVSLSSVSIVNNRAVGAAGTGGAAGATGGSAGGAGGSGGGGGDAMGGGVFNAAGSMSISNSQIAQNAAIGGAGGKGGAGGDGNGITVGPGQTGLGGAGGAGARAAADSAAASPMRAGLA